MLFGRNTKYYRNGGGRSLSVAVFLLLITSLYMRTHLCMIHVVSFRRLFQLGGHRNASFSLSCWLFLALPILSFSPLLQILLLSKSFSPLRVQLSFFLFFKCWSKIITWWWDWHFQGGRGREGSCFGVKSGTSFPMTEIALLRAARGRDNEKENPYLASVPVKILKRVPPHILHLHTHSSPEDLVLLTIPSLLFPVPHHLLCARVLPQLWVPWLLEILSFRLF